MKMLAYALILGFLLLSAMTTTSVQAASINEKQAHQRHRIQQGIQSGELTQKEAIKLGHQQAKIANKEKKFKSDGQFTKKERAIIRSDLERANRNIYHQKHDQQNR